MAGVTASRYPVVDLPDFREIDVVSRVRRNRAQPFGQTVRFLVGEEAFRIAFVVGDSIMPLASTIYKRAF